LYNKVALTQQSDWKMHHRLMPEDCELGAKTNRCSANSKTLAKWATELNFTQMVIQNKRKMSGKNWQELTAKNEVY
jgi:hypothetical protein